MNEAEEYNAELSEYERLSLALLETMKQQDAPYYTYGEPEDYSDDTDDESYDEDDEDGEDDDDYDDYDDYDEDGDDEEYGEYDEDDDDEDDGYDEVDDYAPGDESDEDDDYDDGADLDDEDHGEDDFGDEYDEDDEGEENDEDDEDDSGEDEGDAEADAGDFTDIPGETQYLYGDEAENTFTIDSDAAGYSWAPTEDGNGIVVWGPNGHDLLYGIEAIQFNDQTVSLVQEGDEVDDVAFATQHLVASGSDDAFVIDGDSENYGYGPTEDGTGIVVWGETGFDILYGFSTLIFNDSEIDLADLVQDQSDVAEDDLEDEDEDDDFIGFDDEGALMELAGDFDEDDDDDFDLEDDSDF